MMRVHQHDSLIDALLVSLLLSVNEYIHLFVLWNVEEDFLRSSDRSTMPDLRSSQTNDAGP